MTVNELVSIGCSNVGDSNMTILARADYVQFVKASQLEDSQFPKAVIIASGREIIRPKEWS